jgi:transposase InsO family protein
MPQIAAMDLFVVPTLGFNLLYVLIIVRLARRELVWINVTSHPTAEWVAQQITEAFPWGDNVPRYLIRDRDAVYGAAVTRRLRAMGIRDKPIAPSSPWQNSFAERMIGTIRRECVDHVVALGERHLRRILKSYATYYNSARTHRSLNMEYPVWPKNSSEALMPPPDDNNAGGRLIARGIEQDRRGRCACPVEIAGCYPSPDDCVRHGNARHIRSTLAAASARQTEPPWTGTPPSLT